jgi:diguanylate cyclase (GGDEF)-like protein
MAGNFEWVRDMLIRTTAELNPESDAMPVRRSAFSSLRQRLAQRPDSEHQGALIRIAIAILSGSYLAAAVRMYDPGGAETWYVAILILVMIPFSVGILVSIFVWPQISVARRILSIIMDVGATTYALYFLGAISTPVYGVYLFNACGNGFRYGTRYLFLSSALGVIGFAFVLATSEYWASHRTLGVGLLIVLIVIPIYFASLVRQLHAAMARMRVMATHDTLTGLPNRHSFYERLRHTLNSAKQSQKQFAVVFIDLDGFKPVNDAQGHAAGDAILKSVARRLEESVRKNDIVARFGGDEFVIILFDIHKTAVPVVASKIIATVAKPHEVNGHKITLTSSAGLAVYPDDGRSVDELVAQADAAMYRAKRTGRNCYCFANETQITSTIPVYTKEHIVG